MISEPLKFVVLGEGERTAGVWEVVSVTPRVTVAKVFTFLVLAGIAAALVFAGETWPVKCIGVVPAFLSALVWLPSREKGYLVLTDRRLIHYHRTQGVWQNAHGTSEMRIEDISGLRAEIEKSWGLEVARLYVLSVYHDAVTVATFASSVPILGAIPGIGRFFRDTNMGADTLRAIRELYARVRAVRGGAAFEEAAS